MRLGYAAARRALLVMGNTLSRGVFIGSLLAAAVLVACAVLFYAAESRINPEVDDMGDGFVWVTRTLLQQEPPFEPATGVGSFLYYVVVITGVGIIAMITAGIASRIIRWVTRKDSGMGRARYAGHIVICGWSPEGHEILRELHADEVEDKRPVAIVAPLDSNPTDDDLVTFIKGSPNDAEALKRAGIERAETAIILADGSNPSASPDERDAMTLLSALAVETLNPKLHTCVEVIRSHNVPHFSRAKVDEVVVSAELAGNLLAASAKTHGLSRVVSDLTGHESGSEFYSVPAPRALHGRSFAEALAQVKGAADAIVIGVGTEGARYELNPAPDRQIEPGDRLLCIAHTDPTPRVKRLSPAGAAR